MRQFYERMRSANASVRGRVVFGLLANFVGKFWIIIIQLVSVPILTVKWGANGYGVWLMLTTVPTYIALSSFGFGTAAAIDMTQKFARDDRDGALAAFQSVWLLLTGLMLGVAVISLAVWSYRNALFAHVGIAGDRESVANAALLLVIYSIGTMQMSIISVGFQSTRRYAQGTVIMDLLLPLEGFAVAGVCLAGYGIVAAAAAMTTLRIVGTVAYYLLLIRFEPWMKLGWSFASAAEIKRLSHPAIASLSMALSTALSLQGLILSIGMVVSPAAAAVFATARLLTRSPLQFIGLVNRATLPEMTAAHSQRKPVLSAKLVVLNLGVTALIAIPSAIVLVFIGPAATSILSRGRLHATALLLFWLGVTAAFQGAWNTVGQFLYAINRQQAFAYHYLALAAVIALVPWLQGKGGHIESVAAFWCLAEGIMLVVVYRAWWRESDVRVVHLKAASMDILAPLLRLAPR